MRRLTAPALPRLASGWTLVLALGGLLPATAPVQAQTPSDPATPPAAGAAPAAPPPSLVREPGAGGIEPRVERIALEDSAVRIDELRVGGQTRQIAVSPKSGAPAYEVSPAGGTRVWNMLRF